MALKGPNEEDKRKLHAEINQLVNQRFVLTTISITVFGIMGAWMVPNNIPGKIEPIGAFCFAVASLLLIVLFLLFILSYCLCTMIRNISTYMVITGQSGWEEDWVKFRQTESYIGYTKPQGVIFIILGILSVGFPFVLWAVYPFSLEPRGGVILTIVLGALYCIFIYGIAIEGWFSPEKLIKSKWEEIKKVLKNRDSHLFLFR